MRAQHLLVGIGIGLLTAGSALALYAPYAPRVYAFPHEYTIAGGILHVNGTPTHTHATLVGLCENGSVWVLEKLAYPRNWRWGVIVRGNFTEDPLMSSVTINWRASRLPEC